MQMYSSLNPGTDAQTIRPLLFWTHPAIWGWNTPFFIIIFCPSPQGNMPFPACSMLRCQAPPSTSSLWLSRLWVCMSPCLCACAWRAGAAGLQHPRPAARTQRHLSPSLAQPLPTTRYLWARASKAPPGAPESHVQPHSTFDREYHITETQWWPHICDLADVCMKDYAGSIWGIKNIWKNSMAVCVCVVVVGAHFFFLFYLNTENEWYEVKHTGKLARASLIKM